MNKGTKKMIKYYELLACKKVERGSGYSKGLTIAERTIKKSTNIEDLIKILEEKYDGEQEWILMPKYLMKVSYLEGNNPFRYEKEDFVIVKQELKDDEMIEGVRYEKMGNSE